MKRWIWTLGDLLRALLFIPPAVLTTVGLLGHWHGWRDEWAFAGWSILVLAGLTWRGPKALLVPTATTVAFILAAAVRTWPEDPGRLAVPSVIVSFAVTGLGIAAGLALGLLYGAFQGSRVALPTRRQVLAEVGTLAILVAALIPLAFGSGGWVVVPPALAVVSLAAVRQPRHCWLLAFETWLAFLVPLLVYAIWFAPAQSPGYEEPIAGMVFESLVLTVPAAWIGALLGKGLGALARRFRSHPGDREPALPAHP